MKANKQKKRQEQYGEYTAGFQFYQQMSHLAVKAIKK